MIAKCTGLMGCQLVIASSGLPQTSARKDPTLTKEGALVLRSGFREWIFVGGPVTPNALNGCQAKFPEFHDVYIQLDNLRYYQTDGNCADGTVVAKELALDQTGKYSDGSIESASCRGYFPGTLQGLDVFAKDIKRFSKTHDWGFSPLVMMPYPKTATLNARCAMRILTHCPGVAKTDTVWARFYPTTREVSVTKWENRSQNGD